MLEISNRGGKSLFSTFQYATAALAHEGAKADDAAAYGNAWLLEQGYTIVWVGWQFDVPLGSSLLRVYPPPTENVEALIRSEFVPHERTSSMSFGDRNMQAYVASGPVTLTIRDSRDGKRKTIPSGWKLNAARTGIEMEGGFAPWQIYEAIYPTKNPPVAGVGLAAVRDFISFLRYENRGETLLGDQRRWIKRTIAFGTSQSGRFLRHFVYEGFNADEKGRVVFDGVWANVAGGGRGSFNQRGAQPSRDGHPTFNYFYPSDIFPFTDLPQNDPLSGKSDGLLAAVKTAPKIFYTNGSYEYWGRSAALIHVTPDGQRDAEFAPQTRIYFVAGSQHGPGRLPPPRQGTLHFANMNDYKPLYRALLQALDAWIKDGVTPPDSVYPRLDRKELIPYEKFPGTDKPPLPQRAWRMDYTTEPPRPGAPFPLLLPALDADGNEVGGVRMPEVAVPLARFTGWNYRSGAGVPAKWLSDMTGATLLFSPAEIRRRYPARAVYEAKVRRAAEAMVAQRYLLAGDVDAVVQRAGAAYDWALAQKP